MPITQELLRSGSACAKPNAGSARVPLIVGVTGHRNIPSDDFESLKQAVRQILRGLKRDYSHTPLLVLSSLAEGADCLVAEVALEPDLDIRLIAVLPWPSDSCPREACRPDDRMNFKHLVDAAAQTVAMPLVEGVTRELLDTSEDARQRQYEQVGRFVARHSQILIALWDGVESKDSGTARVIGWQRDGTPASLANRPSELDDVERGPVFRVVTPRVDRPRPDDVFTVIPDWPALKAPTAHGRTVLRRHRLAEWLAKFESLPLLEWHGDSRAAGEHQLLRTWENLDRFNRDAGLVERECRRELQINKGYLVPAEMQPSLPAHLKALLEVYARADTAASWYQSKTFKTTSRLFVGAFVAVVALELYAHFLTTWWMLATHLILLLVGYGLYRRAQRRAYQPRYLDYRALAEALRVQIAWQWAGLTDAVADHYLRHFRGDLDWIRLAARNCFLVSGGSTADVPPADDGESLGRLRQVCERWIEDQRKFFAKRGPWNEGQELVFQLATRYLFRLAVLVAVVLVVIQFFSRATGHEAGPDAGHGMSATLHHGLIVALFCALVLSALIEDYAEYAAYAIHSRKYHWMAGLYATARDQLDVALDAGDVAKARLLLWELGKEALAENADWVVEHRDRLPIWHGG